VSECARSQNRIILTNLQRQPEQQNCLSPKARSSKGFTVHDEVKQLDEAVGYSQTVSQTPASKSAKPSHPNDIVPHQTCNLQPLLQDLNADWKHVAVSTLGQNNHAVRDERWRYIRYADGSEELYDHHNDPNEWNNLATRPLSAANTKVIEQLRLKLPQTNLPQRKGTN